MNKAWQNTGTQGQQMSGVREQQAKLVKVSSGRQSSEGPKGTSTLLGPASSFSTIKEGARCFYLEGSKGWPEFHCTGTTSNAQGNSVHTSKAQGQALSHTLLASPGQSSLRSTCKDLACFPSGIFIPDGRVEGSNAACVAINQSPPPRSMLSSRSVLPCQTRKVCHALPVVLSSFPTMLTPRKAFQITFCSS